ncbi:hypothetical protein SAMN02745823_00398 [Sporobacter termitidis DSM 10068]|uniref:Beta-lactamase n=1 Tax=Sporobacter termitidis DSM 10068 TaxID=1123282 RepID=A0A1M5U805_9FIRM|nr:hypothetical protein [Sporobacter termitidis]SHH59117.1 hypothetical protein SAMN02745823_00398 [Sporobacter termitidis DSM 10068]
MKQGLLQDVNTPIVEFFGDVLSNQSDIRKQHITLYHLLTMSAGLDWPEFGEWNYFAPMEYSKNINLGANGLSMTIQDMLKFGYLYLKEGTI